MKRPVVTLVALLLSGPARAQEPSEQLKAECATAYAETQRNRQAGKPVEALRNAVFCAQQSCPELLVGDCTRWVNELEASLPTVVLEARDGAGNPLSDVAVAVDGEPSPSRLDGRSLPINPGEHHFRFEHQGQTVERRLVVVEGAKNQRLVATFRGAESAAPAPPPQAPRAGFRLEPLHFVPLGLAVVGGVGFGYFGLKGNARYAELEGRCAPRCSDDELAPVRRDWLLADVSLGVSVVSLGVFGWLLVTADGDAPPAQVDVSRDGAAVRYRARF